MATSQISKWAKKVFKSIKELCSFDRMLYAMVEGRFQSYIQGKEISAGRILSYGVKKTESFYSLIEFGINAYEFNLKPKTVRLGNANSESNLKSNNETLSSMS